MGKIRIERLSADNHRLTWGFRVNPSLCNNPDYFGDYLRYTAISDWKKGLSTTHLVIEDGEDEKIIGYISLRASSYAKDVGGVTFGQPAIEIFELAVADGEERAGLGTSLVKYATLIAADMRRTIGVRYVILLAEKNAVTFYEKLGFAEVESYGEVPRDQMNQNCIPMYLLLPEEQ